MKPKQAIRVLENQLQKLQNVQSYSDRGWITQTRSYIKSIFGETSEEYDYIQDFDWLDYYIEQYQYQSTFLQKKSEVHQFIQNCIETVRAKGTNYERTNFLSRIDNATLVTITIFLLGVIGTACYQWGKYNSDLQNIKLNQMIEKQGEAILKLRDTVDIYKRRIEIIEKGTIKAK